MQFKSAAAALALALLSTASVASTAAFAADLPSRREPPSFMPPPIPVFTWTGIYIGGQVGYEFGKDTATPFATATGAGLGDLSSNPNGIIGGAHIGYNFSTQGLPVFGGFLGAGGVFGIEGDVDGSNYHRSTSLGVIGVSDRQDIQGSIRGRLGIAVDRVLFYATGGAAFGDLHDSYFGPTGVNDSFSRTKVGYTVGGGVEYALTNNWSVRGEYRYTDYGTYTDTLVNSTASTVAVRHRATDNRVQGGFSYKFDTFSPLDPVVARY